MDTAYLFEGIKETKQLEEFIFQLFPKSENQGLGFQTTGPDMYVAYNESI